jgi:hypothetical protein
MYKIMYKLGDQVIYRRFDFDAETYSYSESPHVVGWIFYVGIKPAKGGGYCIEYKIQPHRQSPAGWNFVAEKDIIKRFCTEDK